MGDQLEARLTALENNQEEFGHDIREIKGKLAKIMKMLESFGETKVVHPQGSSSLPRQLHIGSSASGDQSTLHEMACQGHSDALNCPDDDPVVEEAMKRVKKVMDELKGLTTKAEPYGLRQSISSRSLQNPNLHQPPIQALQTGSPTFVRPPRIGPRPNFYPRPTFQPHVQAFGIGSPSLAQPLYTCSSADPYANANSIRPPFQQIPNALALVPPPAQVKNQALGQKQSKKMKRTQLDPLPITYGKLFPYLLERHLIAPVFLKPLEPPYPIWYNANARCEYHAGNIGHSIEDCKAFKYKVKGLIDAKLLDIGEVISQEFAMLD